MVQLEEVKDAELNAPQPGPASDEYDDDADFTDTGIPPIPLPSLIPTSSFTPSLYTTLTTTPISSPALQRSNFIAAVRTQRLTNVVV